MKWVKSTDYEGLYATIVNHLSQTKKPLHKCYDSVLLIQLVNGLRISEAVRAYQLHLRTLNKVLSVPLSRKKKPQSRLVIIPDEVVVCSELGGVDERRLTERIRVYTYLTYRKLNTHTLRYASIMRMLESLPHDVVKDILKTNLTCANVYKC
ncbi:MAG: hypothetical protein ACK416_06695 [Zestosphaera sp.]